MQRLETIVTISEENEDIEFTCPYCEADISQDFLDFFEEQDLGFIDILYREYRSIKCPFCGEEIEAEYEFD